VRLVRKADNLPPSYTVVMKSGSLNFLEPSGPVMELLYFFLDYNYSFIFRPNCRAIFRLIFEQVECTNDNAFNL